MWFKSIFTIPTVAAISFCLIGATVPAAADIIHVPGDYPTIQESIPESCVPISRRSCVHTDDSPRRTGTRCQWHPAPASLDSITPRVLTPEHK